MKTGFAILLILTLTSCSNNHDNSSQYKKDFVQSKPGSGRDSLDLKSSFFEEEENQLKSFGEENFRAIKNRDREIIRLMVLMQDANWLILRIENRSFSFKKDSSEKIFTSSSKESESALNFYRYEHQNSLYDSLEIKSPYLFKQANRKIPESEWSDINNLVDSLNVWEITSDFHHANDGTEFRFEIYRRGRYKEIQMDHLSDKRMKLLCNKVFNSCPVSPEAIIIFTLLFSKFKY